MQNRFNKVSVLKSAAVIDPASNRRTPRRAYARVVGVMSGGKYFLCRAHEIGEGGMLVEFPLELKNGALVLVSFILPISLETVVGRAEVVYQRDKQAPVFASDFGDGKKTRVFKTGVKFLNLDTLKRRAIRDFVSSKPVL